MFRVQKDFEFSSAHSLQGLPEDHPCSRMHGHNYTVRVILEATGLNEIGFVRDYRDLDKLKEWLDLNFDHRCLNELGQHLGNPTAENMARAIYLVATNLYPEVTAVGVSETRKTWAWYMPELLPAGERVIAFLETAADEPIGSIHTDRFRLKQALQHILA